MRGPPTRHPDQARPEMQSLAGTIQDASLLAPGDRVVYPNQGVCAVVGVEVQEISGFKLEMIRMRREEDGAAVMVPRGKVASIGLRRVASGELLEGTFHLLAAPLDDPELNWKIRHRDNADRLVAGGILGVAEVVRGLHALARLRPLPTKEREQYDNARHLLVDELAAALAVAPGLAEDFVDFALMPPVGITFKLKPPPAPVPLPARPQRRKVVAAAEAEGDGLDDLGLDGLDLDALELGEEGEATEAAGLAEGAAPAADVVEGEGEPPAEEPAVAAEPPRKAVKPARAADVAATAASPAAGKAAGKKAPPQPAAPPVTATPKEARPAGKGAPKASAKAKAAPKAAAKAAAKPAARPAARAKAAPKAARPAARPAKVAPAKGRGGKKK